MFRCMAKSAYTPSELKKVIAPMIWKRKGDPKNMDYQRLIVVFKLYMIIYNKVMSQVVANKAKSKRKKATRHLD